VPAFDIYGGIHRALRLALTDLLVRMGTTVPTDPVEVGLRLGELERMFEGLAKHIAHEEAFLHPALERRRSGAARDLDLEHEEHAYAIRSMRDLASALAAGGSAAQRAGLYRTLYLRYSAFVGETLIHMAEEEAVTQPLFDELYSAAEQRAIHDELIASIPPHEMLEVLKALLPAVDHETRVAMLTDGKAVMPPEAFAAIFHDASGALRPDERARLAARLGVL